ncbi:undecaprenyl-diphosphate phosphatase [Mangrovicella endophytica]|uniref:undecaprenyl-diphosphate phosphatase n=1 Tax=Mangrovicella endophytica TaxID=2066697 RepID=UPI000C9E0246|nr:undecaprenyl-diphosphate phosphatase [Mangrovicella endophytica]
MDVKATFDAIILGLTEGLTEFLPVSSTGHILLLGHFLGFKSAAHSFEVLIQLGAILAVLSAYFARLWQLAVTLPTSARSRRFVAGILLAFLPAAIIGALAHDLIKTVLFDSPRLICTALIVGGVILLVIDKLPLTVRYRDVMDYPLWLCGAIGVFQCLALIPGTSRSGATIVGALLLGTDKRSAAEFSFFLAMPTMAGAFAYDLIKSHEALGTGDIWLIAVGFTVAFIAALLVVKALLDFVSRHGFTPFAWWRIGVGALGLLLLSTIG